MTKNQIKKVFIAGGTGYIGYYTALKFLDMKIKVSTIALDNEIDNLDWFSNKIDISFGNLFEMTDTEIVQLLKKDEFDAFIYALGPDDRVLPDAPAIDFFREKLVKQATRICECAKEAKIKRCVVLGSYFSHFDKLENGELSKYHPYIKARREQEENVMMLADDKFDVMIVELPYIFGKPFGRKPLWRDSFLANFDGMKYVALPKGGGTAVIDVRGVAEAIVGITFNGENKKCYPVSQDNFEFKKLVPMMMEFSKDDRPYKEFPAFLCAMGAKKRDRAIKKMGKESGLLSSKLMTQIQNKQLFIDPTVLPNELNFKELGLKFDQDVTQGIKESMEACYPERF